MFLDLLDEYTSGEKLLAQDQIRYNCLFCGEEKHKFYVQDKEPYLWHCKHCDRSGNPVKLVMMLNSVGYGEAKDILETYDYYVGNLEQNSLNEKLPDTELTESEKLFLLIHGTHKDAVVDTKYKPNKLPTGFKYLWDNKRNPESFPYFNYLIKRGISLEMIKHYNIGYVVSGSYVHPESGKTLSLRTSVVFVTFDEQGNEIYWNTRNIDRNAMIKSINAPADEKTYSKKNTIFNLDKASKTDKIVIYEGVINALMSGDSGIATFGKQITGEQVKLLENHNNLPFYIFLDTDAKAQAISLARELVKYNKNTYLVVNPYGNKDANDLGPAIVAELVSKAVKFDNSGKAELAYALI